MTPPLSQAGKPHTVVLALPYRSRSIEARSAHPEIIRARIVRGGHFN
jgi:hypothetical protein